MSDSIVINTDLLGKAPWSYTGIEEGTDTVEACYINECDEVSYEWQFPANVYLNPASAPSCIVGQPHVLRATVNRRMQGQVVPLVNKDVAFRVKSGPNAGMELPSNRTDETGDAFSQCTGNSTGTNVFEACIIDNGGVKICSTADAIWRAAPVAVPGLALTPEMATRNIGRTLSLTATLTLSSGTVGGKTIAFDILTGPHSGQSNDVTTSKYCAIILPLALKSITPCLIARPFFSHSSQPRKEWRRGPILGQAKALTQWRRATTMNARMALISGSFRPMYIFTQLLLHRALLEMLTNSEPPLIVRFWERLCLS